MLFKRDTITLIISHMGCENRKLQTTHCVEAQTSGQIGICDLRRKNTGEYAESPAILLRT